MEPTQAINTCSVCHQPVLSSYYFCPNCGNKLSQAPLSTTIATQVGIYAFSIILPFIGFIFVTRWPGVKYFKSEDPKTKQIGQIAWLLILLSTVLLVWLSITWAQAYIKSTVDSINTDFSGL